MVLLLFVGVGGVAVAVGVGVGVAVGVGAGVGIAVGVGVGVGIAVGVDVCAGVGIVVGVGVGVGVVVVASKADCGHRNTRLATVTSNHHITTPPGPHKQPTSHRNTQRATVPPSVPPRGGYTILLTSLICLIFDVLSGSQVSVLSLMQASPWRLG